MTSNPKNPQKKNTQVPSGNQVDIYDATHLVGLRTIVCNTALEYDFGGGEKAIEVPSLEELMASAAIARCLMPVKLKGSEIRAMRHIMKMTLAEIAQKLDERTAPETI